MKYILLRMCHMSRRIWKSCEHIRKYKYGRKFFSFEHFWEVTYVKKNLEELLVVLSLFRRKLFSFSAAKAAQGVQMSVRSFVRIL